MSGSEGSSGTPPRGGPQVGGLARHSLVYSVAPLVQKALALLLVHLYTSVLAESRLGVVEITDVLFAATLQVDRKSVV